MHKKSDASFEELKEKISSLKDSEELEVVREVATELAGEAAEFVRKYPMQSILGAAAVGFILGSLFGRKR